MMIFKGWYKDKEKLSAKKHEYSFSEEGFRYCAICKVSAEGVECPHNLAIIIKEETEKYVEKIEKASDEFFAKMKKICGED